MNGKRDAIVQRTYHNEQVPNKVDGAVWRKQKFFREVDFNNRVVELRSC